MVDYSMEETTQWVNQYWVGYVKYMTKHYPELFEKFDTNIHPPQKIGGCVGIMQGKNHSDKDYAEIMKVSKEFCEKYENPYFFPKDF